MSLLEVVFAASQEGSGYVALIMGNVLKEKLFFKYWAKTGDSKDQFHLLPYHCLDVAAVGWQLLNPDKVPCQFFAKSLGVASQWLQKFFVFCLMLHDLGKFSRSFQRLRPDFSGKLVRGNPNMIYDQRHDSLGYALWQKTLRAMLVERLGDDFSWLLEKQTLSWLEIVFGHHGVPPKKSGIRVSNYFEAEDEDASCLFVCDLIKIFLADFDPEPLLNKSIKKKLKTSSWQLAGITVLADWLGSNGDYFSFYSNELSLEKYWNDIALPASRTVMAELPVTPEISPFSSIKDLFPFIENPTPLQTYAIHESIGDSPQLFILEDVTGAGKTEAALVLTWRLLNAGLADGLYVALPTMATANGMYERLGKVYRKLYKNNSADPPSLILAHGARQLSEKFRQSVGLVDSKGSDHNYYQVNQGNNKDMTASAYCKAWLADSRKKSLLADVGVGTIDQALLAVLPARHQSLRLFGLSRKVLLVDEVHAYDPYMFKLLENLLAFHASQGGSALLLSATLPYDMRQNLVSAFQEGIGCRNLSDLVDRSYPLATHYGPELSEQHIDTRTEVKRTVTVYRKDDEEAVVAEIRQTVEHGQSICWIRNTVKSANETYRQLVDAEWLDSSKLHLFHSRFAMVDRQEIENDILARFGEKSGETERCGQVLIATQVVEQSLDLDFDVLVTDLAPIDLIIQRAGRLCRHVRDPLGNRIRKPGAKDQRDNPALHVLAPKAEKDVDENWLKSQQPGSQAVYLHVGQLWLTARLLFADGDKGRFVMPDDAREFMEGVYSPEEEEQIPQALLEASFDAMAKAMMNKSMADFNSLKMVKGYTRSSGDWDEESKIPTRLTEHDTVAVALAVWRHGQLLPYAEKVYSPWAMSTINLPEYQWQKAKESIPKNMANIIKKLKEEQNSLRWLEVFPLSEETAHFYSADQGWQP